MRNFINIINEAFQRDWGNGSQNSKNRKATATVGIVIRSKYRKLLDELVNTGRIETYTETKNILNSVFEITGPYNTLLALKQTAEQYSTTMDNNNE